MRRKTLVMMMAAMLQQTLVAAQTVVRDSLTGQPVAQASVLNGKGVALGLTDAEGRMPDLKGCTVISISHIGYAVKTVKIKDLGGELLLSPIEYPVREVVKERQKPYCLKLTGYLRKYVVNDYAVSKRDTLDVPPLLMFQDGIYSLYLFGLETWNTDKARPLVTRNVLTDSTGNSQKEHFFSMNIVSYPERVKNGVKNGKNEVLGDTCYQEVYRVKKKEKFRRATIRRDTVNKTITCDVDLLAPKETWNVNLGITKLKLFEDTESYVYRMTGYERVGQADLLAYRNVRHSESKGVVLMPGTALNNWTFVEFFPYDAEFLTHKEYKDDKKEVKASTMTIEDIDRIKAEIHVPPLSAEIEQKLQETHQWYDNRIP